ncbi:hypothetical protein BGX38DRAFT_1229230 [Terfezia claveryi]|nr:hypothetical protein BGX38DRAFT_1229230 [Terfezia claveryi]
MFDGSVEVTKIIHLEAVEDVAVVIIGLDAEWESEAYDRQALDLPKDGCQDAFNIRCGRGLSSSISLVHQYPCPWVDEVPAIVQACHQGQETLAGVLLGHESPSGKLPRGSLPVQPTIQLSASSCFPSIPISPTQSSLLLRLSCSPPPPSDTHLSPQTPHTPSSPPSQYTPPLSLPISSLPHRRAQYLLHTSPVNGPHQDSLVDRGSRGLPCQGVMYSS